MAMRVLGSKMGRKSGCKGRVWSSHEKQQRTCPMYLVAVGTASEKSQGKRQCITVLEQYE